MKFFRNEAKRDHWLEQVEVKHAEFPRVVLAFEDSSVIWGKLAESGQTPGHTAYANRERMKFKELKEDAEAAFRRVGITMLREVPEGRTLADQVILHRKKEEEEDFPKVNA